MKEIKLLINEEEKIIKCQSPKGRDTKKGLKLLMKAQSAESEKEGVQIFNEYLEFLDEITSQGTGMSIEELDDLPSDEKDKLVLVYQDAISNKIDFLMSSLKRGS